MNMHGVIPPRKPDSHKGDYGHLLIIGGSPGLTGAVCLAGSAALRTGCGLATVALPESLNAIVETKLTEVMSLPLPETTFHTIAPAAVPAVLNFLSTRAGALVIGPGISQNKETAEFVREILRKADRPVLIDADALRIVAGEIGILRMIKATAILTPHPGEMAALTGMDVAAVQGNREQTAQEFARRHQVIVVLKGHRTVVTDGMETYENHTGNPGMATAGSGDVLSGIIGSLLAQGIEPFAAATTGVYVHGAAGDRAAQDIGEPSLIASDIISYLPAVLKAVPRG